MIIHLHWLTLHLIIAALSITTVKAWFATTSIHSIRHESLHWSTIHADLWDANALQNEWPSALPLPQNCQASLAERARSAMTGCPPPALEGRLKVNFDAFDVHWEHVDPPVLTIDNFLTEEECDNLLSMTNVSPPQGAGRVIQMESRTSASNRVRSGATLPPPFHHVVRPIRGSAGRTPPPRGGGSATIHIREADGGSAIGAISGRSPGVRLARGYIGRRGGHVPRGRAAHRHFVGVP